jgi:sulfatase maturation enzyme AslB (radical SAM superfamily)
MTLLSIETGRAAPPFQPLIHLDALWIQVAGTLCNLSCTHCFVSSGPANHHHALMSRADVRGHLAEALELGVRELYFTGGEPFLHPELLEILDDSLVHAPSTVLTNGTLFTPARIEELKRLSDRSRHSLELRVSLDGSNAVDHDRVRGEGSFERTLAGLVSLDQEGLLPIVTITRAAETDPREVGERYRTMLEAAGITRPRLKQLPFFQLGREADRTRPYGPGETLAGLEDFDRARLPCAHCRAVTSNGAYVCPLLVEEPGGRMGARLAEAMGPFLLSHGACYTCHVTGMTCANH